MFGFAAKHRGIWPPLGDASIACRAMDEGCYDSAPSRGISAHCLAGPWMVTDALIPLMVCKQTTAGQRMAIWRRGRPKELLHRSDQSSQYTSEPFQRLMADNGVTCSMRRSGNLRDRAMVAPPVRETLARAAMESVFSSLRIERVKRKVYCTRDHARADIFDDIERFCNPTRCHSTIGYPSPIQYDERAMETQGAAHETGSNFDSFFAPSRVK